MIKALNDKGAYIISSMDLCWSLALGFLSCVFGPTVVKMSFTKYVDLNDLSMRVQEISSEKLHGSVIRSLILVLLGEQRT